MIRVQVPATTANLGPGFDCLGMALQLYNTVEMQRISSGLHIEVHGEGSRDIARDEKNIVYQAAMRLFKQAGKSPEGLKIKLTNNIPIARGLGSSAAAIIGGLIAANTLIGGDLSHKEILSLATTLEGHPDNVAPALLGGIVVSVPVDSDIKYMKINPPPGLKAIMAIPDFFVMTKRAREILPQQISLQDAVFNLGRLALLLTALSQGDFNMLSTAMEDRIHQPYRSNLVPGLKKVLAAARLAGARGVCISGAGPSLLALADNNFESIAQAMKDTFKQNGVHAHSLILELGPIGATTLELK
ncbi:MAG: homoserine kinase [Eubacteriales bacterium]